MSHGDVRGVLGGVWCVVRLQRNCVAVMGVENDCNLRYCLLCRAWIAVFTVATNQGSDIVNESISDGRKDRSKYDSYGVYATLKMDSEMNEVGVKVGDDDALLRLVKLQRILAPACDKPSEFAPSQVALLKRALIYSLYIL